MYMYGIFVVVVVVVLHHAPAMYLFNHLTIIMEKLFNGILLVIHQEIMHIATCT